MSCGFLLVVILWFYLDELVELRSYILTADVATYHWLFKHRVFVLVQDPSLFSMVQTVMCWRKRLDSVSRLLQFEELEEQFLQFAVKLLYVSCKFAVLANQIIDISAVVLVSLVIRASGRVALIWILTHAFRANAPW